MLYRCCLRPNSTLEAEITVVKYKNGEHRSMFMFCYIVFSR